MDTVETLKAVIIRLWDEGGFFFSEKHGPGIEIDGLLYEVNFPEDELTILKNMHLVGDTWEMAE